MWIVLYLFTFFAVGVLFEQTSRRIEECEETKTQVPTRQFEMDRQIDALEELRHRAKVMMIVLGICGILIGIRGL